MTPSNLDAGQTVSSPDKVKLSLTQRLIQQYQMFFTGSQERDPGPDILRFTAILLVMFRHFLDRNPGYAGHLPSFMNYLCGFGWSGVDLFFVLSGYLVGGHVVQAVRAGTFSIQKFYLGRALRIFPAYYAAIFLNLLIDHPEIKHFLSYLKHIFFPYILHNFSGFIPYFLFIQNYTDCQLNSGTYWSLAVEEQFYLILPLFTFLIATRFHKHFFPAFSLAWICIPLLYRTFAYFVADSTDLYKIFYWPFISRADALGIGVICFLLHDSWRRKRTNPSFALRDFLLNSWVILGGVAIVGSTGYRLALSLSTHPQTVTFQAVTFGFLVIAISYGLILLLTVRLTRIAPPVVKLIVILGAHLSYSGYLYHTTALNKVNDIFHNFQPGSLLILFHLCAFLLLTFAMAFLSYALIERPFLIIKRRLSQRSFADGRGDRNT